MSCSHTAEQDKLEIPLSIASYSVGWQDLYKVQRAHILAHRQDSLTDACDSFGKADPLPAPRHLSKTVAVLPSFFTLG